jgi:hypothetical protein
VDSIEPSTSNYFVGNNDNIPLTIEFEPNFKQIGTTFVIVFQILIVVCIKLTNSFLLNFILIYLKILIEVGVFTIPILCGKNDENCRNFGGFDIFLFVHGGYWILKYSFDRFIFEY